jgi:hypothetical protein
MYQIQMLPTVLTYHEARSQQRDAHHHLPAHSISSSRETERHTCSVSGSAATNQCVVAAMDLSHPSSLHYNNYSSRASAHVMA